MAKSSTYLTITSDDDHASRILALAVKFFGSGHPIPSSTIRAELYPTLNARSFQRQYLRDRNLLASLGIAIREIATEDDDSLWQVDEASSYITGREIDANEARMLYVLCYDMASDQSFPYRDELRVALAKISQMYRGTALPSGRQSSARDHKLLATLVSCLSNRQVVQVEYTDAAGNSTKRRLALLGTFGLRDHTYFVASAVDAQGELAPDTMRIFRLDRFDSVAPARPVRHYEVPADFAVDDYVRLPFQIGDAGGTARVLAGPQPDQELLRAMASYGQVAKDGSWTVSYGSAVALASWCVGVGATPLEPAELVDIWRDVLHQAAHATHYDETLGSFDTAQPLTVRRGRAGRVGSAVLVRQLMTVASSLTREGEVLTATQIAQTLGVDYDQARHLIMLMSLSGGESLEYLPIIFDDEYREVFLMQGAQLSAPRLRLTRPETIALLAALTELGIPADDPLAVSLSASFGAPAFSADDVRGLLQAPDTTSDLELLRTCSNAIANGRGLRFAYRPVTGGDVRRRTVVPTLLRRRDDNWYLEAFDLDRQDDRVFRVDHMDELTEVEVARPLRQAKHSTPGQSVVVRFCDPFYLELFYWEGLEVLAVDADATIVRLPRYHGSWLARHLAACAASVQVSDADLAAQIGEVARQQIV